VLTLSI